MCDFVSPVCRRPLISGSYSTAAFTGRHARRISCIRWRVLVETPSALRAGTSQCALSCAVLPHFVTNGIIYHVMCSIVRRGMWYTLVQTGTPGPRHAAIAHTEESDYAELIGTSANPDVVCAVLELSEVRLGPESICHGRFLWLCARSTTMVDAYMALVKGIHLWWW